MCSWRACTTTQVYPFCCCCCCSCCSQRSGLNELQLVYMYKSVRSFNHLIRIGFFCYKHVSDRRHYAEVHRTLRPSQALGLQPRLDTHGARRLLRAELGFAQRPGRLAAPRRSEFMFSPSSRKLIRRHCMRFPERRSGLKRHEGEKTPMPPSPRGTRAATDDHTRANV